MSELRKYYTYDLGKVVEEVRIRNASRVLIQLPDGLKHYATELLEELTDALRDVEFTVDANPIYGSCVLNRYMFERYDAVLHFGHEPYPYTTHPEGKVVFLDFLSNLKPSEDSIINKLEELLRALNAGRVAIYTVHQHKKTLAILGNSLTNAGIKVLNNLNNAAIMGCWFNDVLSYSNAVDSYIIVSSGLFHPLGVGLLTKGQKHIIQLDLYRGEVRLLDNVVEKYLRVRYGKVMSSLDARSWCLIHGVEGQFRSGVRKELINALSSKGFKYIECQSLFISRETLRNVDSGDIDVFVITACPRIPIDDLQDFEKPVLTPGEAFMVLRNVNDYIIPW